MYVKIVPDYYRVPDLEYRGLAKSLALLVDSSLPATSSSYHHASALNNCLTYGRDNININTKVESCYFTVEQALIS